MSMHRIRLLLTTFVAWLSLAGAQEPGSSAPSPDPAAGFAVPQPGRTFHFPADHGSHPEFRVEWWYITGHLFGRGSASGERYGFQATFFRQAASDRSTQIHLAHMAVVDTRTGRFLHQERLNRAGWDAAAATSTLDVRQGPWSLRLTDEEAERMNLRGGVAAQVRFELDLQPAKPLVVFGENGVSRKGDDPTAASHYLTFTRLRVEGRLEWQGEWRDVEGQAWMDHEFSSSQLSRGQVGWDWVSLQLEDGREVMLYRLRRADGSADPASRLTWVSRSGETRVQSFEWAVLTRWRSPHSGGEYPARTRITTTDPETGGTVHLLVEPLVPDQELPGELSQIPYWEGACRIRDEATGQEIGSAYMELTGYAKPLAF